MTVRSITALLQGFAQDLDKDRVCVGDILEAFHERGFGAVLFILALPAAVPLPGLGINVIIALPLLFLTAQQMVGRHTIWLPEKTKSKSIKTESIRSMIATLQPWLERLEFFVRPRLGWMTQGIFSNLIGLFGFIMAVSVTIPLPLTNTVPSMGIALMALGVFMRDGLAVIAGAMVGLLWIIMMITVIMMFGTEGIDLIKDTIKAYL